MLDKLPLLLKRGSMKAVTQLDAAEASPIVLPGQDLKQHALQESVELAHWNTTDIFPPGMSLLCPLKKMLHTQLAGKGRISKGPRSIFVEPSVKDKFSTERQ